MSNGTFLGSFLLEQSVTKQRLTHNEMMTVKLNSAVNVPMIKIKLENHLSHANTSEKH